MSGEQDEQGDLAEFFKNINDRVSALESEQKGETYQEFIAKCRAEGKSMEECAELWKKHKEKEGETDKAYPKTAYGADFVRSVISLIRKIGAKIVEELLKKLEGMSGEELIYVPPKLTPGSPLPQEEHFTGEEDLINTGADLLLKRGRFSNIAHQQEIHRTKVRLGLREPGPGDDEF